MLGPCAPCVRRAVLIALLGWQHARLERARRCAMLASGPSRAKQRRGGNFWRAP